MNQPFKINDSFSRNNSLVNSDLLPPTDDFNLTFKVNFSFLKYFQISVFNVLCLKYQNTMHLYLLVKALHVPLRCIKQCVNKCHFICNSHMHMQHMQLRVNYKRLQPPVPQTALSAALRETSPQHPIPH